MLESVLLIRWTHAMRAKHRPAVVLPALTLGIPLLLASLSAQAAPVYQWKDAKGVTHYSDKPPSGENYKDRHIDPRGEPAPQAQAVGKPAEDPQCTQARRNLELLSSSNPVMQTGADGKATGQALDETQRANQRALAEAAQKAYCR